MTTAPQRRTRRNLLPRAEDPTSARLSFAIAAFVGALGGWAVGMKAALDGPAGWLLLLVVPMVIGFVLILLSRRTPQDTTRTVLNWTGRGLFWGTVVVGLISYGGWSWLHAAVHLGG